MPSIIQPQSRPPGGEDTPAADGRIRRDLPPVAMRRYAELYGSPILPGHVVIVGDAPLDIDCAHANCCIVLDVATGPSYSLGDLQAQNADLPVSGLSDTEGLVAGS